ncbi:hypothetical protein E8E14_000495 [Neopestalotiopsis sp. 37M]|nr:hypothetical protein E8E14_000495 [Neopestalotiopsis sp. 37M]
MAAAFGAINGILGIWKFADSMIPKDASPASNYRVYVGLEGFKDDEGKELSNAHGDIETIKTYNIQHELIGSGGGLNVGGDDSDDQYADIEVEQKGNSQSIWTEFYAGDDAICIAAITATMDEGTKWAWTGDWGYWCGLNWFPSGYVIQNDKDEQDASPMCTWLDKDHSEDLKAAAIGVNWSELKAGNEAPSNLDELKKQCGDNMQAWPDNGGDQMLPVTDKKKRSVFRRSQRSDDRLVVSRLNNHNATEVCESWSSWGPDFVSEQEGVYCNMETHEAVPLCDADTTVNCFDLNTSHGPAMVRRNGKRSPRNPSRVITWG